MKKIFVKMILFINIVCVAAGFFNVTTFADTQYTVSVSILSDNITLAQYTVLSPQQTSCVVLGGDRASFTENERGAPDSITVNGRTLKADETHNIVLYFNGRVIESCSVKVDDGDSFVFKYVTVKSEVVSSKTPSIHPSVSSRRPPVNSIKTSSVHSSSAINSKEHSSGHESSEETSDQSDLSSQAVSSDDHAATSSYVNPNRYKWDEELNDILDSACSWLTVNDESVMQLIALSAAGKPAKANSVDKFLQGVKDNNGVFSSDAELFDAILSSTFSGVDAENVRDVNLIQIMTGKKAKYLKTPYYSALMLISLDSNDYLSDGSELRREIVNAISAMSNKDGGFGIAKSDIKTTAIVLTALSKYKSLASDTITNAVAYISNAIKTRIDKLDGTQVANIIIAINSLGLSMDDRRFLSDGVNLVEIMKNYIGLDGGFKNSLSGSSDSVATEYFVLALVSLRNGISPYVINYQSRDDSSSDTVGATSKFNFYLSMVIALIFFAVIGFMAFIFVYAKKKHLKGGLDTIKFIFENKNDKK